MTAITDKGRGWVEISETLLLDALHMPDDVRLVAAEVRFSNGNALVRLLVDADGLPPVIPHGGEDWPTYTPWITHHAERFEWAWGVKNGNEGRPS